MDELDRQRIAALFPRASRDFIDANLGLRAKTDKPASRKALERPVEGKEKVPARVGLSYVLYRVRLLDPDAVVGATKVCTDVLQQIGIIPGDGPGEIDLEVAQEKVSQRKYERTFLKITYP